MTIDKSLLKDALTDLELYRDFIIKHDIPVAIQGKCNYLAALGLSTYTEVFGGFYRGNLSQGSGKKNYDAFINISFTRITWMWILVYVLMDSEWRIVVKLPVNALSKGIGATDNNIYDDNNNITSS